jgi:exosortase
LGVFPGTPNLIVWLVATRGEHSIALPGQFAYPLIYPPKFSIVGHFTQVAPPPGQTSEPTASPRSWWQLALLTILVGWLYSSILYHLAGQWTHDQNYSHAFFVPVFSLFVLWQNRAQLASLRPSPSLWGFLLMVFAVGLLVLGSLGAELFLSRLSLLFLIAGLVVFFLGWSYLHEVLFPLLFLILMIPIPAIILNQITFPLQLLTSKVAAEVLPLFGVPVFREGNVITLSVMKLEVAEACSGIRSLLSLITLAIIYGYLLETRLWIRIVLALASIPIAVAANSLRIIGTGLLVEYWDPSKAEGFFHGFEGWILFVISLVMLFFLHKLLGRFGRKGL